MSEKWTDILESFQCYTASFLNVMSNTYRCHYCPQSKLQFGLLVTESKVANDQLKEFTDIKYDSPSFKFSLPEIMWYNGV